MQIKLIILIICVSLVTIGFAAPPPQANKPADKANDALGSILGGSNSGRLPLLGGLLNGLLGGKSGKGQLGSLLASERIQPSKPQ
ncbi:hypothetical protein RMCBS344292_04339 [Rhizopus microsporus]|nr:hypothetical protein RMCBS344292_04334 [Rhizopus microsporus]CEI90003.1 hypothetical protein RMCBS344292_04339 [Rhizopus microsporus]